MRLKKKQLVFGLHAIIETLLARGKAVSKIWLKNRLHSSLAKKLLRLAQERCIPCSRVPLAKLNQLAHGNHQGALALLSPVPFVELENLVPHVYAEGRVPLIVVLDQLQDVHNLGAIARTALATRVDALVISTQYIAPISGAVMKVSAGALAYVPVCRVSDLSQAFCFLKGSGLQVVACTEKASQSFYEVDFTLPTALLLGSEGAGIQSKNLDLVTEKVHIPMYGPVASLNVSVAAGVVLYEVFKQRKG